jgi:hypothetical protein
MGERAVAETPEPGVGTYVCAIGIACQEKHFSMCCPTFQRVSVAVVTPGCWRRGYRRQEEDSAAASIVVIRWPGVVTTTCLVLNPRP